MNPELFIDLETTGTDERRHEITELAALDADGRILIHELVKVERPEDADPDALLLNGYDAERWRTHALPWSEVATRMKDLFDVDPRPILVGHFIDFDRRFLERRFEAVGLDPGLVPFGVVDTYALAHEHLGDSIGGCSLAKIVNVLGIAPHGALHRAAEDADLARRAYLMMRRAGVLERLWWRLRAWRIQRNQ
jgi:DNA polymerase III epsilon subunit-like protein